MDLHHFMRAEWRRRKKRARRREKSLDVRTNLMDGKLDVKSLKGRTNLDGVSWTGSRRTKEITEPPQRAVSSKKPSSFMLASEKRCTTHSF